MKLEADFEKALARMPAGNAIVPFCYVEIGMADCQTFAAVVEWMQDHSSEWIAIAIDPSEIVKEHFERLLLDREKRAELINRSCKEAFEGWSCPVHFCLIDGSRSEDFKTVEPWVQPGGLIVFRDCKTLDLIDGTRPGWRRLPDWTNCKVLERIVAPALSRSWQNVSTKAGREAVTKMMWPPGETKV